MPMGNSAGRSSKNRQGEGAERRATPRERDGIDPPGHEERAAAAEPQPVFVLSPRGHRVLDWLAWSIWLVACGMFTLVLAAWFGLI